MGGCRFQCRFLRHGIAGVLLRNGPRDARRDSHLPSTFATFLFFHLPASGKSRPFLFHSDDTHTIISIFLIQLISISLLPH